MKKIIALLIATLMVFGLTACGGGAESTEESSEQKNYREEDAEYEVENGVIVVNQGDHYRAMELFGGGTGNTYVDTINTLRSKLDSSVMLYSVIAPLSCEFYLPANYEDYSVSQKDSMPRGLPAEIHSALQRPRA